MQKRKIRTCKLASLSHITLRGKNGHGSLLPGLPGQSYKRVGTEYIQGKIPLDFFWQELSCLDSQISPGEKSRKKTGNFFSLVFLYTPHGCISDIHFLPRGSVWKNAIRSLASMSREAISCRRRNFNVHFIFLMGPKKRAVFFPASILSMLKLCGESVYHQKAKGFSFSFAHIRGIRNVVKYCTYEFGVVKLKNKICNQMFVFPPSAAQYNCRSTSTLPSSKQAMWLKELQRISNLDLTSKQIDLIRPPSLCCVQKTFPLHLPR